MIRFARTLVLVSLVAAGCGNDSARSLLPIDIFAAADVGAIANVDVTVSQGGATVTTKRLAWDAPAGQALKIGIYLAHSVSGSVGVSASALDASNNVIGTSDMGTGAIDPGKTAAVVTLHIVASTAVGGGDGGVSDGGPDRDGAAADQGPPGDGPSIDGQAADQAPPGVDVPPGVDATPPDAAPTGPSWGPIENIEPNDVVSKSYWTTPAVDAKGNVFVAWAEDSDVKGRRWDATTKTWGDTKVLASGVSPAVVSLKTSPDGHFVAAFLEDASGSDDPLAGPWATQSNDDGVTWAPVKHVHTGYGFGDLDLQVANDGGARITWTESMTNLFTVWAARYDQTTGAWLDVAAVKAGDDANDRNPRLAMSAAGAGLLVWNQNDASMQASTWAVAFAAGGPLQTPQLVDTTTMYNVSDPVVAMAPDGSKGIAVWSQNGASGYDVYSADYTPSGGWAAPTQGISNSYFGWPVLVMDSSGTATVVYVQPLNAGTANVVAARRAWGQAWGEVTPLETTDQAPLMIDQVPNPYVALAGNGDVHVAWGRKVKANDDNTFAIVTRHWSMGAWQPEDVIFMKDKLNANEPGIGAGQNGQAALAFTYWDPTMTGDTMTYSTFVTLFH